MQNGTQIYISIGSNIERNKNIGLALQALEASFGDLQLSSVYESPAIGFDGAPFYNLVAGCLVSVSVWEVAKRLDHIEQQCGRLRGKPKFSSRTLDLDLLLYGNHIIESEGLHLPRGEITQYAFVLAPLAEIAGQAQHPQHKSTYAQLWAAFEVADQPLWRVDFNHPRIPAVIHDHQ